MLELAEYVDIPPRDQPPLANWVAPEVAMGEPDSPIDVEGTTGHSNDLFLAVQLDEPAAPILQPKPRYPPALQAAGITGHAIVEYIVGADGKVEQSSVRILSRTHEQFEAPARDAILGSTFRPARYRGQRVRQLVNQRVTFQLGF